MAGTENSMQDEENYDHIFEFQSLKQTLMPDIRGLRGLLQPSATEEGDAVSAVVIAIQMIRAHCKELKYNRKIVLVTNARGRVDGDENEAIGAEMRDEGIEFTVIGVDFDVNGFKEEDKDPQKKKSEKDSDTSRSEIR